MKTIMSNIIQMITRSKKRITGNKGEKGSRVLPSYPAGIYNIESPDKELEVVNFETISLERIQYYLQSGGALLPGRYTIGLFSKENLTKLLEKYGESPSSIKLAFDRFYNRGGWFPKWKIDKPIEKTGLCI